MTAEFFIKNLDIVFFVYGLAFVVMGIAILVQPRSKSIFRLSDVIWLLAGFGLSHGLNEWLDAFAIIRGHHSSAFNLVRLIILAVSYLFLFEFGRRLVFLSVKKFLTKWVTAILCLLVLALSALLNYERSIWPRYLLGFPGGLLSAFGLVLYYRRAETILGHLNIRKYFIISASSLFIYGILGGIITPKADFFPASILNDSSFLNLFGIPVQVIRAICAIVLAWSIWNILHIFNWEIREKLKSSWEEAQRAAEAERKKASELEKAYRELEELQGALIQAEKMNAVGRLASGVAHEVRNPLSIILQGIEYLEVKIPAKEIPSREALLMIKDSVKRADNIISLLFDFSKAARLNLSPEDINSILESSISLAGTNVKFENIDIVREIKDDMPKTLVDKNRIEQVFVNLLLNAIQAMPEGGKLFIRSYDKQLKAPGNGVGKRKGDRFKFGEKVVVVEVEDTGTGIPEENLKKIFDPFFTTKGARGGAGLGLYVSQNIIVMHKGLIDVTSQLGKGTKITVTLPAVVGEKDEDPHS